MKRFSLFCIANFAAAVFLYASETCAVTDAALVPEPFSEALVVQDYESGAVQTRIAFPHFINDDIAYIDVPWNPQWIGAQSPFLYHHGIARIACVLAGAAYGKLTDSGEITGLSYTYRALGFAQSGIEYHYDVDYDDEIWGVDQSAFSFARQTVRTSDGAARTLVAVVIGGTAFSKEEWISNINVADSLKRQAQKKKQRIVPDKHEGFAKATQKVYGAFLSYLAQNNLNSAEIYVLITGHSRGASIGNLLAVALPDAGIASEHIYAYTFATPNVSRAHDVWDEKYGYIWNIVNQEDIVPTVPFESNEWGYRKYGRILPIANYFSTPDIHAFSEEILPAMNDVYRALMERDYFPFKTGNFFPYLIEAALQSMDKDVIAYYSGIRAMHDPLVVVFSKFFSEFNDPSLILQEQGGLLTALLNMIEEQYPGFTEKAGKTIYDMHCSESYFAWMLSTSPWQLFRTCSTYIVRCSGRAEVVVTDADGALCARVINGIPEKFIQMSEIPVFKLPSGDVCIGIPGNRKYTLTVSHDSVLPSGVDLSIETILGNGTIQKKTTYPSMSVHWLKLFTYTFAEQAECALQKVNGMSAAKTARQNFTHEFHVKPVLCADTDWNIGIALQASFVYGYGLLEVKTNAWRRHYDALTVAPGIGVRSNIIDALYVGLLGQWQFAFDMADSSQRLTHVPSAAVTFAYQPRKSSRIFMAASADFGFSHWNEHAFGDNMRPSRNCVRLASDGSAFCVPQLRFGVAF